MKMNFVRLSLIVLLMLAHSPLGLLTSAISRTNTNNPGVPVAPIERVVTKHFATGVSSETTSTNRCKRGSAYWLSCSTDKSFPPIISIAAKAISMTRSKESTSTDISNRWESRIFRPPRLI